jgi:hypothetical protein
MHAMSHKVPVAAMASTDAVDPVHAVTYLVATPEDGDLETGTILLDGRPIGRLSHRGRLDVAPLGAFESPLAPDSVWRADAIGWLPHDGRPWDTRITSTAPTRRRAAEDLLRAYSQHR